MSERISTHYDQKYFDWQAGMGAFGAWANGPIFAPYLKDSDVVLDFGCGAGDLLAGLPCAKRLGVEVNPNAAEKARANGLEIFDSVDKIPDASVDAIISNHCLEHTLRPLDELKGLHRVLKPGGKFVLVVPAEGIKYGYEAADINHHLYTWSPMSLGNLVTEAGFSLIESKWLVHKWPPKYQAIAKLFGRPGFEFAAKLAGRLSKKLYQVRAIATKL
jgi:SAM-dependent methyltransferase